METPTDAESDTFQKGEPVPRPGVYRCGECGEIWATNEKNVRFPPCTANKSGAGRWVYVGKDG
jgi:rubrerythrin